jgi:ketosteroid isomerase-like protein
MMRPDARRSDVDSDDLERLLIEHTDAWNSHDIDRLMSLFADDCVFEASGGPESYGCRFGGRAQVRDNKIVRKNSFRKQRPPVVD